ncbi:DUF427 domain-containing protein [Amycolatopsis saalfeldensis]|uniref:Uncharacterized conserved protein, DUF427 family n=1 Tax=Amycolatopsis saalfeldensis TaxID=394193 RepID=A0A1H8UMY7_9PSEU|nr:DUF427 domain-containing protein [Amycolatopsis saalfeldensis]SEP04343.1 Uncharacterized conserved protein, DUF427 family [Amycolatopsis saalfeldensis]
MPGYPAMITETDHVEPVPRRIRATLGGRVVLDTTRALYVWEWPPYPQFYIPVADVTPGLLFDEDHPQRLKRGTARRHALRVGEVVKPAAARVYGEDAVSGLAGHVRFEWAALDSWFEEDEEVFVHPRNPYTRVDALRSTRHVRVALEGVTLAESSSPVLLFETGLPTRYYFNRTEVDFTHLVPTTTVTACPYKGRTTGYWSIRTGGTLHQDLAWAYDFPTVAMTPIAGLVSFYNEKLDIFVDGEEVPRPSTHFFN